MASGGTGTGSGSQSFDFGSDDVLCAYDDFTPNDPKRSDTSTAAKDFHESRTGRPLVNVYGQHEAYHKEDVISAVDKCMKKYADNLLLFLEGISGRLSQLELYCYKLERSIGDLRSDMVRDQSEKELQLKSLEKHLQEVHRSVQILRDKQELAETQKELSQFQIVKKELSATRKTDEGVAPSEPKRHNETPEIQNQHLALVPRQAPAPPPLPAIASEQNQAYKEPSLQQPAPAPVSMPQGHYLVNPPSSFYLQHTPPPQDQQGQTLQQYVQQRPQFQEQALALPQHQAYPQFQQQQWSQPALQQLPPQAVQHQQALQPQAQPQSPPTYPPYQPHQPTKPVAETYQGSMAMQVPYSTIPQSGGSHADGITYVYGGPGGAAPQLQQHQRQAQPHGSQSNLSKSSYTGDASYLPPQPNLQGYSVVYSSMDGSRVGPSQNIQPGGYLPSNMLALQNQHQHLPAGQYQPRPQPVRNQSYMEMVDKAVSMGYSRDHALSVMQRMAESGQAFDLNHLLDRLNTAGATPRGWSP